MDISDGKHNNWKCGVNCTGGPGLTDDNCQCVCKEIPRNCLLQSSHPDRFTCGNSNEKYQTYLLGSQEDTRKCPINGVQFISSSLPTPEGFEAREFNDEYNIMFTK